jgi:uncharacterized protein
MTNVETVQAMYDAFVRGDIPAILENVSDDVHWEEWPDNTAQKAGVPWLQPRRGKEGVTEFFRALTQLDFKEFTVLSIMGNGNKVASELVVDAVVKTNGHHYRDEQVHVWTFDDSGRVTRFRHYLDTAKQMAAAGVKESVVSKA